MSVVSDLVNQIKTARFGKDVRSSIADAITEIDSVAETAQGSATAAATTAIAQASEAVSAANNASQKASEAVASANEAKMYAENAQAVTGVNIATEDTAGIIKGGENSIADDGTLELTRTTTDRTMNDSYEGGLKIESIEGKSEQDILTGKNLLNNTATSKTDNGVTFTANADKSITAYGTATALASVRIDITLKKGSYVLSGCPIGGTSSTYHMRIYNNTTATGVDVTDKSYTFNIDEDTSFIVRCCIENNYTANNLTFYPMIRLSTITDSTYEPYCGGIPAPNPSYPQEIASVGDDGNVTITSVGANLINPNEIQMNHVVVYNTGYIAPNTNYNATGLIRVIPGKAYTGLNLSTGGEKWFYDKDNKAIRYIVAPTNSDGSFTFTVPQNLGIVYAAFSSSVAINVSTWRLNEGTKIIDEPYHKTIATISLSEPLRSIGDVKDTIELVDGKWNVVRRIVSLMVDGNSGLSYYTSPKANGEYRMVIYDSTFVSKVKTPPNSSTTPIAKCTRYKVSNADKTYNGTESVLTIYQNGGQLFIYDTDRCTNDANVYKAWTVENPFEVIAEMKAPTYEVLSDDIQKQLFSMKSFNVVTNVTTNSAVDPDIVAEYGTSKVGGHALEALNIAKKNEIAISGLVTGA